MGRREFEGRTQATIVTSPHEPFRLWLWHYVPPGRNYAGYHLTADRSGQAILPRFLENLGTAKNDQQVTLTLAPLAQEIVAVPANPRGEPRSFNQLRIILRVASQRDLMTFSRSAERYTLELSSARLDSVAEGILALSHEKDDYCIGDVEGQELWFWRCGLESPRRRA